MDTVATSTVNLPSVVPGLNAYVDLDLPEDWADHDALELLATDPHGRTVMHWTLPISEPAEVAAKITGAALAPSEGEAAPQVTETEELITLSAAGVTVSLDKGNGTIASVRNTAGPITFGNGPRLTADTATLRSVTQRTEDGAQLVEFTFDGPLDTLTYRMLPSGLLQLDYAYSPTGEHDFMGVTFDYPEDRVTGVRYLGDGPYRVWKNRLQGVDLGLYEKAYNNTVTGESWDYPEFKGYYANLYWATVETTEQPFTLLTATPGKYLHLFTPDSPPRCHQPKHRGPLPHRQYLDHGCDQPHWHQVQGGRPPRPRQYDQPVPWSPGR